MTMHLALFKENLESFARNHKNEINKNPVFRRRFQQMCEKVGVDPLASHKGFWAEFLGVGDFYYELSVQVIDVCLATQSHNGGLLSMDELLVRLARRRGEHSQRISEDDVHRAIRKVAVLGNGFRVLRVGSRRMVVSVPLEMNRDHVAVMELAGPRGWVTAAACCRQLQWPLERVELVLHVMMEEGMTWVDEQMLDGQLAYWFPSLVEQGQWSATLRDDLSEPRPGAPC